MSTVSPRRTIIYDVSQAVEQSGGGPQLVSSGGSTVWTEKTPAEDTPRRECTHDVDESRLHKGTMWMSNDRVPLKNVESPYGGGVSSLPGAAGVPSPVMFPVAPVLLAGGPQLGPWQVAVVRVDETPAGDQQGILPNGSILVLHRIGIGRLAYMSYLTALHILLWRRALLAQKL